MRSSGWGGWPLSGKQDLHMLAGEEGEYDCLTQEVGQGVGSSETEEFEASKKGCRSPPK